MTHGMNWSEKKPLGKINIKDLLSPFGCIIKETISSVWQELEKICFN